LHISEHAADNIIKAALAYLVIGSHALLLLEWKKATKGNARIDEGGLKMDTSAVNWALPSRLSVWLYCPRPLLGEKGNLR
jgi:hypothetical protein